MAKISAKGSYIAVDDSGGTVRDISNDCSTFTINMPSNLLEVTGIDKSAPERIVGVQDTSIGLEGYFNPASNLSHDVFKTRTTARTVTLAVGGNTSGNAKVTGEYLIENYDLDFGDDGTATWSVTLLLESGTVQAWTTV